MLVDGENLPTIAVFPTMMTVPDCLVVRKNKIGGGHGESKFYISSKDQMYAFYGTPKFTAKCFMLKSDLIAYMDAIKSEYLSPTQPYAGRDEMASLWSERRRTLSDMDDVIYFTISDQEQISGPRGYINSHSDGYQIIRTLALPNVSYIYAAKVGTDAEPLYYWKLFVDFDAIAEMKNGPLVYKYGKCKQGRSNPLSEISVQEPITPLRGRPGQAEYRRKLLEECPFCPITMVSDDRLLIASHIKPFSVCTDDEKYDSKNGYILTSLYDKLFDNGYITFTENRHMILSDMISQHTWDLLNIKQDGFYQALPMDDARKKYLDFHHSSVFKGAYFKN